ncbi:unnamed protein product, partial [Allacma fusca]
MISDSHDRFLDLGFKFPSRMGVLKSLETFDAEFFGIHPKQAMNMDPRLRKLLEVSHEAIMDAGLNPKSIRGSNVGVFVATLSSVFCEGRTGALPVGSVKSNMGHSEPVAILCSIAKLVLSHVARTIPANLHYHTPNPDIPALVDGRLQVVDKNQAFHAKYVGINSMGFGGTNVHLLLKFENQQEYESPWSLSTPLIIACSGRTEEAVRYFLENALQHKQDQHFVKLLHELSVEAIPRHPYRGYVVANANNSEIVLEKIEPKNSIWYIFSGMGSQWPGMTKDLIKFDAFKMSITRSAEYLLAVGFDLIKILESDDKTLFEQFKNAMTWYTPHNREEFSKHKGARYNIDMRNPTDKFFEGHCLE